MKLFRVLFIFWIIIVSLLLGYLVYCAGISRQWSGVNGQKEEIKVYPTGCRDIPSVYVLKDGKLFFVRGYRTGLVDEMKTGQTVADLMPDDTYN